MVNTSHYEWVDTSHWSATNYASNTLNPGYWVLLYWDTAILSRCRYLSDPADWNASPLSLMATCVPMFYSGAVTVVSTAAQPYTVTTLGSASVTSYSPQAASYAYQYLTANAGTYTSRWLTGGGSTIGGYGTSYWDYQATSCNAATATADGDGGDGDGPPNLSYYSSCNYQWLPVNANPWYYPNDGVAGSANAYTSYTVNNATTSITGARADTLTYNTINTTTGSYNALTRTSESAPVAIASAGAGRQLAMTVVQAQGVEAAG